MHGYKGNTQMSEEEERIRGELEMDIEKDLEGEIKEEIYRLALRLHRLYQHQRDKQTSSKTQQVGQEQLKQHQRNKGNNNKALYEVNISIKMEGGTKVEIKEIMKRPWRNNDNNTGRLHASKHSSSKYSGGDHNKFDWANSLRSGSLKSCHNVVRKKVQIGKEHPRTTKGNVSVAK